jgi:predicted GNAT family N-acyltransferase
MGPQKQLGSPGHSASSAFRVSRVGLDALPICLAIRQEVFIEGQRVPPECEVDGLDECCLHFLAWLGEQPVGTARLFPTNATTMKVQRVAVRAPARGSGIGRALMQALSDEARRQGAKLLLLDSQVEAIPFYERLGYRAEGEIFIDAGIEHRRMRLGLA